MKPHKIEDFVPLAIVDDMQLNQIRWTAEREKKLIPSRHRIYHFSELLEVSKLWEVFEFNENFREKPGNVLGLGR